MDSETNSRLNRISILTEETELQLASLNAMKRLCYFQMENNLEPEIPREELPSLKEAINRCERTLRLGKLINSLKGEM